MGKTRVRYPNREEASRAVAEIKKSKRTDLDAVLVWVNSVKALRAAYPNYYADTTAFLEALSVALQQERAGACQGGCRSLRSYPINPPSVVVKNSLSFPVFPVFRKFPFPLYPISYKEHGGYN